MLQRTFVCDKPQAYWDIAVLIKMIGRTMGAGRHKTCYRVGVDFLKGGVSYRTCIELCQPGRGQLVLSHYYMDHSGIAIDHNTVKAWLLMPRRRVYHHAVLAFYDDAMKILHGSGCTILQVVVSSIQRIDMTVTPEIEVIL